MVYEKLRNYRAINVKFIGATNTLGARICIYEEHNQKRISKIFPYDYNYNSIGEQAFDILIANGFNVISKCALWKIDIFCCDNFGSNYIEISTLKDLKGGNNK